MNDFSVTFLGTGTSHGIPVIGCDCSVCKSSDPHDQRYRSSILIQDEHHSLVIDTGPEFRLQALRAGIKKVSGVLYTHDHADHFNGIDDLRVFCRYETLPVYCSQEVARTIQTRFSYVLKKFDEAGGIPHLAPVILEPCKEIEIAGFPIIPIPIYHGNQSIFAFRIGSFVYATDCSGIPDKSLPFFKDIDTLVIGALRYNPHPTHFSVSQAVAFSREIGAKRTYFTHMCHDISHCKLEGDLPLNIRPAYDMLTITIGEQKFE
ncbi:MBL fold metallo-hydrolase [uncultured Sphaerochaeta sp.]|uniref:MBL fold metallo-hydrolase n=1 Tax=uncultured Sphaerochaeta sp. TaxID=886478 RepID=UPI002A0A934F|nr:MBL fold metallo-hydrolase [uncultured Sphaerochaeta sp.]